MTVISRARGLSVLALLRIGSVYKYVLRTPMQVKSVALECRDVRLFGRPVSGLSGTDGRSECCLYGRWVRLLIKGLD